MPLPLAAIAAAATTAALQHLQQRQRDQQAAASGPQVGKLVIGGAAVRASTIAALGGSAAGFNLAPPDMLGPTSSGQTERIQAAVRGFLATPGAAGTGAQGAMTNAQLQRALGVPVTQPTGGLACGGRRRRRLNVTNVAALRRAGRRLSGFVKLAKKMVTLEQKARLKKRRRR